MEKQEYEKSILEYEGVKDAVECAREDGERDGFEKGVEKGREEGREEGISYMVKTLYNNGIDINAISKMTGLSKDKVEDIIG